MKVFFFLFFLSVASYQFLCSLSHCRTEKTIWFLVLFCFSFDKAKAQFFFPLDFQALFQAAGEFSSIQFLWENVGFPFMVSQVLLLPPKLCQLLEMPKSGYFPYFSFKIFTQLFIYLVEIGSFNIVQDGFELTKPPDST